MFIISILFKVVFCQGIKCKKEKMIKILFKIYDEGSSGGTQLGFDIENIQLEQRLIY